jgi:hypothetical protein
MARARNIKPSFFKNELLVELEAFTRLMFIGLWCLADREGRVEDRPKRIKLELFPCDLYDPEHGLSELLRCGFIKRYEYKGVRLILIVNFLKHQSPHGTEKDSSLPDENGELTVHDRGTTGYITGKKRKNNVNSASNNWQSPLDKSAATVYLPLHNALNPESGILNPDPLNPEREPVTPTSLVDNRAFRLTLDFQFLETWRHWSQKNRQDIPDMQSVFLKFVRFYAEGESKPLEEWFDKFKSFVLNELVKSSKTGGQLLAATITVPGQSGRDPTLQAILAGDKFTKYMPPEIRAALDQRKQQEKAALS